MFSSRLLPALVCAAFVAGAVPAVPARAQAPAAPRASRPLVPLDWRVRTLDGRDVSVSSYRGRPIFLNLWATWCTPCRTELGSIAALRDSLAARGADDVVFLLVATETRRRVEAFARTIRWDLPFVVETDPLPAMLGLRAVPSTWLIDRSGRLVHTQFGAVRWNDPAIVQFVADALS